MEIKFMPEAEEDLAYWKATGNWSRRITDEHRLVYSISNGMVYVYVLSMRFHYSK